MKPRIAGTNFSVRNVEGSLVTRAEPASPVRVVLAYAEQVAFPTVFAIYFSTRNRLARHFQVIDACWSFASLADRAVLKEAARKTAMADLVFCCPHGQDKIPVAVRDWIDHWADHRQVSGGALAVLLPEVSLPERCSSPVRTYLERVATRAGLAFFSKAYAPEGSPPSMIERRMHPSGEVGASRRENSTTGQRHWGINE
ncbi:MAG TPA: hypothetical protein VN673_08490 [Clostridia bacterium]|nr:hypothetical protein [Clostridia bacterium]